MTPDFDAMARMLAVAREAYDVGDDIKAASQLYLLWLLIGRDDRTRSE